MRLTHKERETITSEAGRCFGPSARVLLFGSRTDDTRRGGDIDLLIALPEASDSGFRRKIRFLAGVKSKLGDQHIDVVLADPGDTRPIVTEATRTGVSL